MINVCIRNMIKGGRWDLGNLGEDAFKPEDATILQKSHDTEIIKEEVKQQVK